MHFDEKVNFWNPVLSSCLIILHEEYWLTSAIEASYLVLKVWTRKIRSDRESSVHECTPLLAKSPLWSLCLLTNIWVGLLHTPTAILENPLLKVLDKRLCDIYLPHVAHTTNKPQRQQILIFKKRTGLRCFCDIRISVWKWTMTSFSITSLKDQDFGTFLLGFSAFLTLIPYWTATEFQKISEDF